MTAQAQLIWDGSTNPGQVDQSQPFQRGDFLLFVANDLPDGDGYEFAASLVIEVIAREPVGGSSIAVTYGSREIPLDVGVMDTGLIVPIPAEVTGADLNITLYLATAYAIDISIYAIAALGGCSIQDVCDKVDYANTLLTAQAARSLVGDAIGIASFIGSLTAFLAGDPFALVGVVAPLLGGTGIGQLPFGGEVGGVIDILQPGYQILFD